MFSACLDMHADIPASMLIYTQVYNSEVTLIDWNLLSNFSDFPRAVVRLTGIQKNNIFSAGLDMHANISQYVDVYSSLQF